VKRRFYRRKPQLLPKTENGDLRQFIEFVHERLEKGARDYGNKSFERSTQRNVGEVLCEQFDTAGWIFVLWVQARTHGKQVDLTKDVRARFERQFFDAIATQVDLGLKFEPEDSMKSPAAICDELVKLAAYAFESWALLRRRLDIAVSRLIQIPVSAVRGPADVRGKRGSFSE
jgi:hypothetical protein